MHVRRVHDDTSRLLKSTGYAHVSQQKGVFIIQPAALHLNSHSEACVCVLMTAMCTLMSSDRPCLITQIPLHTVWWKPAHNSLHEQLYKTCVTQTSRHDLQLFVNSTSRTTDYLARLKTSPPSNLGPHASNTVRRCSPRTESEDQMTCSPPGLYTLCLTHVQVSVDLRDHLARVSNSTPRMARIIQLESNAK